MAVINEFFYHVFALKFLVCSLDNIRMPYFPHILDIYFSPLTFFSCRHSQNEQDDESHLCESIEV